MIEKYLSTLHIFPSPGPSPPGMILSNFPGSD